MVGGERQTKEKRMRIIVFQLIILIPLPFSFRECLYPGKLYQHASFHFSTLLCQLLLLLRATIQVHLFILNIFIYFFPSYYKSTYYTDNFFSCLSNIFFIVTVINFNAFFPFLILQSVKYKLCLSLSFRMNDAYLQLWLINNKLITLIFKRTMTCIWWFILPI